MLRIVELGRHSLRGVVPFILSIIDDFEALKTVEAFRMLIFRDERIGIDRQKDSSFFRRTIRHCIKYHCVLKFIVEYAKTNWMVR